MKKLCHLLLLIGAGAVGNAIAASLPTPLAVTVHGDGVVKNEQTGDVCQSHCKSGYDSKATVTLTATPDSESTFLGWSGGCVGMQTTCEVTLLESRNVMAVFKSKAVSYTEPLLLTGNTLCVDGVGANCTAKDESAELQTPAVITSASIYR